MQWFSRFLSLHNPSVFQGRCRFLAVMCWDCSERRKAVGWAEPYLQGSERGCTSGASWAACWDAVGMGFADKVSSPANRDKMSPALSHKFFLLQQAETSALKIWAIKRRSLATEWFGEPLPNLCMRNVRQGTAQVFISALLISPKQPEATNPRCFPYMDDSDQNSDPAGN